MLRINTYMERVFCLVAVVAYCGVGYLLLISVCHKKNWSSIESVPYGDFVFGSKHFISGNYMPSK